MPYDAVAQHRVSAWHETGHAVAYLAHGLPFVRIETDGTGGGEVVVSPRRIDTGAALTITYAGPIAERLYLLGGPPATVAPLVLPAYDEDDDEGSDWDHMHRLRGALGITEGTDHFETVACGLVSEHWQAVRVLAEALIVGGTLTFTEAVALLGAHHPLTSRVGA